MMKIKIEEVEIHYKNVNELNERVRAHLATTQDKRFILEKELAALKKRERSLRKFVGEPRLASSILMTPSINLKNA